VNRCGTAELVVCKVCFAPSVVEFVLPEGLLLCMLVASLVVPVAAGAPFAPNARELPDEESPADCPLWADPLGWPAAGLGCWMKPWLARALLIWPAAGLTGWSAAWLGRALLIWPAAGLTGRSAAWLERAPPAWPGEPPNCGCTVAGEGGFVAAALLSNCVDVATIQEVQGPATPGPAPETAHD
jgi:hypothetical protein